MQFIRLCQYLIYEREHKKKIKPGKSLYYVADVKCSPSLSRLL